MSLSVILAEDDPDIQLVAGLALKRAGFNVTVVGNGQEASEAVQRTW
jgi:CheY-like chemotaxis protein